MALITRSISFPEDILKELDDIAVGWHTNRSHAIIRIIQEWLASRRPPEDRFPPTQFDKPEAA